MSYPVDISLSFAHFLIHYGLLDQNHLTFGDSCSFLIVQAQELKLNFVEGGDQETNKLEKTNFWFAMFLISWISAKAYENVGMTEWCSNSGWGKAGTGNKLCY